MLQYRAHLFVKIAGGLTCASGLMGLLGWILNSAALKSVIPGSATMKVNTAIALVLAGMGLLILSRKSLSSQGRILATVLGAIVLGLGAATLGEYFLDWNLGIDELFFNDSGVAAGMMRHGRMSPLTALCFFVTGLGLLMASYTQWRRVRPSVVTALGVTLMIAGGVACIGQVTNELFHERRWNYGMAVHAAISFLLLGLSLILLIVGEKSMTWVMERRIWVGFAASVVVMLIATGISCNYIYELEGAASWVTHTHQVLREIEDVRAGMAELESSQRGYLILGDENLLSRMERTIWGVNNGLTHLRELTADNLHQKLHLDQLQELIEEKNVFRQKTIDVRRKDGFAAAQQLLASGVGIELSNSIQTQFAAMRSEEDGLLVTRQALATATSASAFLFLPTGVFLSVAILTLALFFLNTGMAEREASEDMLKDSMKEVNDLKTAMDEHAILATTDPMGRITSVNDKFCAISKYSREELIGQDHRILNSGYHPKAFMRDLWGTISRGDVWHGEIKNRAKDGTFYWVDTTIVPFLDEKGKTRQYVAIRADITRQKLAQETLDASEKQFRTMANAIPQLAWMANPDGYIFWYNQRWYDYTGTKPEQMEGWGWQRVHDPIELPKVMERWKESIATAEPFEMEFPLRAANGNYGWFLTRSVPLKDDNGRIVRWFGTNTDLSQNREANAEIRRLNTSLENRVAARTTELEAANKELEAFSFSVSHDLRAPLRTVDGYSQALVEDYNDLLPDEGKRFIKTIREGAQKMSKLIDDLLAFSRLSRAPLNKQDVNTKKQVCTLLEAMESERRGRQVEIRLQDLPNCYGAPALLDQVWVNLLSNAHKYTRGKEKAVIDIGCNVEQGENVFYVRDNGAGFDMRYKHKLFGVFQRLHRADEFEGTGVGLAIVQRIVVRHGGRIWAESVIGEGSTFYFTLHSKDET